MPGRGVGAAPAARSAALEQVQRVFDDLTLRAPASSAILASLSPRNL
jgi:hypothetical protein